MDAYKTPDSNSQPPSDERQLKPINAVFYGLLISIVMTIIVSIVEGIVLGIAVATTQGVERLKEDFIANNSVFLLIDIIVTFACLFYAGKVTGRFAPRQEIKFGLIVSVITFIVYFIIYSSADSTTTYPSWYNITSFMIIFIAILMGSYSTKHKGVR